MSNRQASSFTGFLIKDPELITPKKDDDRPLAKVTFFYTENRPVKDSAGAITSWEETASVAVTAFARGNWAQNVVSALRKGDLVTVSGSWHFDQWTDEKVRDQYRTPRTSITVNADDISVSLKNPGVSVVNAAMVKASKEQGNPCLQLRLALSLRPPQPQLRSLCTPLLATRRPPPALIRPHHRRDLHHMITIRGIRPRRSRILATGRKHQNLRRTPGLN